MGTRPKKADKLKLAFQMCAEGKTNSEILLATGIVSGKNGFSTLFRNRAYLGERIYNTTRRASLSDKKTRRLKNTSDQWVTVKNDHPSLVDQELFDRVQSNLDKKRPQIGQTKRSPQHYILAGLLWCKKHSCTYVGHTPGAKASYYACGNREKYGKKVPPCPWLKKEAIEKFIISNLKTKVFTRNLIRKSIEALQMEQARNKQEDDSEKSRDNSKNKAARP